MTDWPEIVRQHGPMVWRTAYRLLNHDADAADCFQRAFVAALELSRKEPIRHWPALLKQLATARALERLQQRRRDTKRSHSLPAGDSLDGKGSSPDLAAEAGELAEHLRLALGELEERQAQVFCLACLEDWSYQEIAEQLELTVNHVGVLLNRARLKLRALLRAHNPAVDRVRREVQS